MVRRFHERGYDVVRETEDFDRTWVGTETRDYNDGAGAARCSTRATSSWLARPSRRLEVRRRLVRSLWDDGEDLVEQARQTILAGARESLLFCYGSLIRGNATKNVEVLRKTCRNC